MAPFRLSDFLPYQLSVASNAVSRAVADRTGYMARFGLTATEWRVLAVVTAAKTPTQAELLSMTGMDKMSISRAVAVLQKRSLVDRSRNPDDGRTLRLSPTLEGIRIHDAVAVEAMKVETALLAICAPGEAEMLRSILARLRNACDQP